MSDDTAARRTVVTASVMIVVAQLLAIAADVVARQNDPSDVVGLVALVVLAFLMLRRVRWARWITVAFVAAGGLLELLSVPLLVATRTAPAFWDGPVHALPVLHSLQAAATALATAQVYPFLLGALVVEAALDLSAVGLLVLTQGVRAYFGPTPDRSSA